MIQQEQLLIPSYLCDRNDRLSLWALARLFQEIADHHIQQSHIGFNDLIKQKKAWVLCRMFYKIDNLPAFNTMVQLRTWSRGSDGLYAVRDFQLLDANGNLSASATAYWVVIDFNTRHVVRLDDIMSGFEHHNQSATNCDKLRKLRLAEFCPEQMVDTFQVKPSMLDHTHHVNNAEYIRWIVDNMHDNIQISTLEIDYLNETTPNEVVKISRHSTNNSLEFQISNSRGVSASARITIN